MVNENITVCHVPTGERFEFAVTVHICNCQKNNKAPDLPEGRFDYKTRTYHISCPACGKELAVYESLKELKNGA
jgi:hypothetical protein